MKTDFENGKKPEVCPSCGQKGKPVKAITVESLLTDEARARTSTTDNFAFCPTSTCEVAYFHRQGDEVFLRREVRVRIGQKETESPRPVCYCFNHTVEEIEAEVAETGMSKIPDEITGQCRLGRDRCEETNPQGSCCLGNVRKVVKEAQAKISNKREEVTMMKDGNPEKGDDCCVVSEKTNGEDTKQKPSLGLWATSGAAVAAVLSSACCWLPLTLVGFGASAAGVAGFFEQYRPYFLGLTGLLLASGFYFLYFRKERCEPGTACADPKQRLLRFNKGMLWFATVVVLAFAFFPDYVGFLLGKGNDNVVMTATTGESRVFNIEGMSCEACATTLESGLSRLPGVARAKVDYGSRTAHVFVESGGEALTDKEIEQAIESAGYHVRRAGGNTQEAPAFRRRLENGKGEKLNELSPDGRELKQSFNAVKGKVRLFLYVSPG